MKNYVISIEDHSGSMRNIAEAALRDSNANMQSVADSSSAEKLDTIVSVIAVSGFSVVREHVISNPHVLKPKTSWSAYGGTPLFDGIWDAIELHEALPDAGSQDVSFLVFITTDGEEAGSRRDDPSVLKTKIESLMRSGRWTFVARMPRGASRYATMIGIPSGNILEWDATEAGMQRATAQTQAATTSFYAARSAGAKSSSSFYTSAAAVNTAALTDITSEVSLYQVPNHGGRLEIRDFILEKRKTYLKGAAFVQLVKTEPKIGPKKIVLIRERKAPNRIFAGKDARQMIGMPTDPLSNARVHPGEHGNYDIFIQSESLNRLLPDSVGVIYWEKQGVPFTQADINKFAPKVVAAVPAALMLPAVTGRTKPTPSTVPRAGFVPAAYQESVNGKPVKFFGKRDEARAYARANKLPRGSLDDADAVVSAGGTVYRSNSFHRWFIYL